MVARKHCIQIWIDIALYIVLWIVLLTLSSWMPVARRGFFCDDVTIRYPYRSDTVTAGALLGVTLCAPLIVLLITELITTSIPTARHDVPQATHCSVQVNHANSPSAATPGLCCTAPPQRGAARCWRASAIAYNVSRSFGLCLFGLLLTSLLTEVGKISVGRLRPHFIDVCRPNTSLDNCTNGMYITEYKCTNNEMSIIQKSQLTKSFPSGHASVAVFVAVFLSYYIHKRLHTAVDTYTVLLRPILQISLIVGALFTCLSRVADNMHHFTDILVGGAIGAAVVYWMTVCLDDSLTRGYHPKRSEDIQQYYNNSKCQKATPDDSRFMEHEFC